MATLRARLPSPPAWLFPAVPFFAALAAFWPSVRGEFINLDDPLNYVTNDKYRELSWASLKWMFGDFQLGGVYQPLVWLSHAVDYKLYGLNPHGFRLTNVVLHAAAAAASYFMFLALLRAAVPQKSNEPLGPWRWSALFAALFFSLHPLRVEVVAWISDRNYVLPGLFFIASMWFYLEARASQGAAGRWGWLLASLAAFALSLFSKAIGMTLPILLLVLDAYPLGRIGGRRTWIGRSAWPVYAEKVPFFLLALVGGVIAAKGRMLYGAMIPLSRFGLEPRIAEAFFGLSFYLEKTIAPLNLGALYTLPRTIGLFDYLILPRMLFVLGGAAFVLSRRRSSPAWLAAAVFYVVALLPFLGLSQYGLLIEMAADKWAHLASLATAALAGGGLLRLWRARETARLGSAAWISTAAFAAVWVACLGALSWRQCFAWRNNEALYTQSIAADPGCYLCHNNLAAHLNGSGRFREALAHAEEALRLKPGYDLALQNADVAVRSLNWIREEIKLPAERLRPVPGAAEVHYRMGLSLAQGGDVQHAIEALRTAVTIDPARADAHFTLGYLYSKSGDHGRAIDYTRRAVAVDPKMAAARFNLGVFLEREGDLRRALDEFKAAAALDPGSANARLNAGMLFARLGDAGQARAYCQEAATLNPSMTDPRCPR